MIFLIYVEKDTITKCLIINRMKVLNKYKNKETGEIKSIWETKEDYENHKGDFDLKFIQIN